MIKLLKISWEEFILLPLLFGVIDATP